MVYIKVSFEQKDAANSWVRENADFSAGDTFIPNKQDSFGENWCVISLPDNGSEYNQKMIAQFGQMTTDDLQDLTDIEG